MRTHKAASCLVIMVALLTGCSDDSKAGDSTATVEFKVTGDSPASVYIPGIKYTGGDSSGPSSKWDVDLDSVRTPWSQKFQVKPGRSLSLQTGSVNPKTGIGCQIFVNGKLVDEDTKKNKPGSTLVAQCKSHVPM
ncbi:hypothetical protein ACH4S9_04640 [Streptomyces sp. NPDC021225]